MKKKKQTLSLKCEMEVSLLVYEVFYLQISTMVPSDSVLGSAPLTLPVSLGE